MSGRPRSTRNKMRCTALVKTVIRANGTRKLHRVASPYDLERIKQGPSPRAPEGTKRKLIRIKKEMKTASVCGGRIGVCIRVQTDSYPRVPYYHLKCARCGTTSYPTLRGRLPLSLAEGYLEGYIERMADPSSAPPEWGY